MCILAKAIHRNDIKRPKRLHHDTVFSEPLGKAGVGTKSQRVSCALPCRKVPKAQTFSLKDPGPSFSRTPGSQDLTSSSPGSQILSAAQKRPMKPGPMDRTDTAFPMSSIHIAEFRRSAGSQLIMEAALLSQSRTCCCICQFFCNLM